MVMLWIRLEDLATLGTELEALDLILGHSANVVDGPEGLSIVR